MYTIMNIHRVLSILFIIAILNGCSHESGDNDIQYDGTYSFNIYRTSLYIGDDSICAELGEGAFEIKNSIVSGSFINSYGITFLMSGDYDPEGNPQSGQDYIYGAFYDGPVSIENYKAAFSGNMSNNEFGVKVGLGVWGNANYSGIWEAQ